MKSLHDAGLTVVLRTAAVSALGIAALIVMLIVLTSAPYIGNDKLDYQSLKVSARTAGTFLCANIPAKGDDLNHDVSIHGLQR